MTEILDTFPRVFRFRKSRINENDGNTCIKVDLVGVPVSIARITDLGRRVGKLVNANPGLKVNRRINFSCIKMVFIS